MKVHDSAPLFCEYPPSDSYFRHNRSPRFLSTTIHTEPEFREPDPRSPQTSVNPHYDRIHSLVWGCSVDLTNLEAISPGSDGNNKGTLTDYSIDLQSITVHTDECSLTSETGCAKAEPDINNISHQGLTQTSVAHDNLISRPALHLSSSSTADPIASHHIHESAIDRSLPRHQTVPTDAEENFSTTAALTPDLNSHSHQSDIEIERCTPTTGSGTSSTPTEPDIIHPRHANKQITPKPVLHQYVSNTSTDMLNISTSTLARSKNGNFSEDLQRPSRSHQRVVYETAFYGFENVDISLFLDTEQNKVPSTPGNDSIEMERLSSYPYQNHRKHISSVAHEGEHNGGWVAEREKDHLRQTRHKRVQRWTPPSSHTASHSGRSGGYRSGDHGSLDRMNISSSWISTYRRSIDVQPMFRVIQVPLVPPPLPCVSEAVFGPDSYDEAVANGTDKKRPPLTNLQKTERVVRRQWKNWLCVILLLALVITIPVVLKKSHSQGLPSSVGDGNRADNGAYTDTRSSTAAGLPRSKSGPKSSATAMPHSTATSRSAAAKTSASNAAATKSAPKP